MAVYRLTCDIEFPDIPDGLSASIAAADALIASGSSAGTVGLHLCRHHEAPTGSCDSYLIDEAWGGTDDAES